MIGLEKFDLLGLPFSLSNQIVDHVGQLFDLNLLRINTAIQLVNNPPYMIRRITNEIDVLLKTIDGVVLLTTNLS
jgi:hypothetical protein